MLTKCHLWKVTLSNDDVEVVFWAYHQTEVLARQAALTWADSEYAKESLAIKTVEAR
jgi:hypothetical protein